jgi:putative intracellular protease/amidase
MIRFLSICLIVVFLFSIVGCSPSKSNNQVLMILQEGESADMELMLTKEVGVMVSMLEKDGYKVVTASASGQPLTGSTTTITPDLKFAEVKIDDYVGLIVPCLAMDIDLARPPEAIEIVKEVASQGKPIAAQMSGILILNDAGVLDGKQVSWLSDMAVYVPESIVKSEGVVQDGNIITSVICPYLSKMLSKTDGTPELTQKFIDTLASLR